LIEEETKPKSTSSLGFRLGSTLAVALLPLGILSIVQARSAQERLEDSVLQGVEGASLRAAQAQIDLIRDAQITARAFAASLSHALEEGAPCVARARSVAATIPEATLVAYIPMSGLMTCASTDVVHDFSDNALFRQMTERPVPKVIYNPMGPVSNTAIIGIGNPVFDQTGVQVGIVSISLPYFTLTPSDFAEDVAQWRPDLLTTLTGDGLVLISSAPNRDLMSALPTGVRIEDLSARAGQASFEDKSGIREILSVTEVTRDLFLVSLWKRQPAGLFDPSNAAAPYLLPGLTWLAALAAAAFASSRLVVRPIRALARSMSDYLRTKSRMIVPDVPDAPAEIQRLNSAYEQLVRTIEQEEAELQNLIVDKDALLREVNHRSGNSLQIIASVMRMYRREAREPGLQGVLDGLITRVIALSSTHTSLYDLSGQRDVPLDQVVLGVVRRLKEIHRIPVGITDKQFQPLRTDAQTAVRVAMAVAEVMGCFFAIPKLSPGQVQMVLLSDAGRIQLQINGPSVPEFQPGATQGIMSLPSRMLRQFAVQLDATLKVTQDGDRVTIQLDFPASAAVGLFPQK
jgi:two-component system, sensor histidine kinase PdtaS